MVLFTGNAIEVEVPPGMVCSSSRFQPGEGPSRGLLRDCTISLINRFAALVEMLCNVAAGVPSNTQLWKEMENLYATVIQL